MPDHGDCARAQEHEFVGLRHDATTRLAVGVSRSPRSQTENTSWAPTACRAFVDDSLVYSYSWAVLAGHFAVWLFFINTRVLAALSTGTEPLCWPFFESCWKYRFSSSHGIDVLQTIYVGLIVLAGVQLFQRRPRLFWLCLLATNLLLCGIIGLDYRLRANEFYMLMWLNWAFLLLPDKRWVVPLLIFSFYFWAGRLKLNWEWVSGSVLYADLWGIPRAWAPAACIYVVVLELVFSWGLLARHWPVVLLALAQLVAFHLESLTQIHWFYPVLMATMLAWFPLEYALGNKQRIAHLAAFARFKAPAAAYAVTFAFAACQFIPYLYEGDPALTGQGRLFAINMFQARQVCDVTAVVHHVDGLIEIRDLKLRQLPPRSICDPIVYLSRVKTLCRVEAATVRQIDLQMFAKRTTDSRYKRVVDAPDACRGAVDYAVFRNNWWLR